MSPRWTRLAPLRIALACAAAASIAAPVRAHELTVETYRRGDEISVLISVDLEVEPRTAWNVLTDYDRLSQFIPDMVSSRVVGREGEAIIVEQKGEFGFLFFKQPVEIRISVVETPQACVVARSISGSFREMEGRYELKPSPRGVNINYSGRFLPAFPLPPFIGLAVFRHGAVTQFEALVDEIRRRDGLARGANPR